MNLSISPLRPLSNIHFSGSGRNGKPRVLFWVGSIHAKSLEKTKNIKRVSDVDDIKYFENLFEKKGPIDVVVISKADLVRNFGNGEKNPAEAYQSWFTRKGFRVKPPGVVIIDNTMPPVSYDTNEFKMRSVSLLPYPGKIYNLDEFDNELLKAIYAVDPYGAT